MAALSASPDFGEGAGVRPLLCQDEALEIEWVLRHALARGRRQIDRNIFERATRGTHPA
jgi:hypothetical protein